VSNIEADVGDTVKCYMLVYVMHVIGITK
jgi:hypothetical protein